MEYGKTTQIKGFKMISHFSFTKQHQLTKDGLLYCPEHELNGKRIIQTTLTPVVDNDYPKRFGKPKIVWCLADEPQTEFNSIKKLAKHYKLP